MFLKSTLMAAVLGFALLPASAAQAAPSAQDVAYLRAAHQTNLAEIAGGRLATRKGVNALVRSLGARFVADHTRLDAAVTATADALGVTLPTAPNAEQQALAGRYATAPRAEFDALYVTTQLGAHAKSLAAARKETVEGADPRAKATAAGAVPVIVAHHHALSSAVSELELGYGQNGRSTH